MSACSFQFKVDRLQIIVVKDKRPNSDSLILILYSSLTETSSFSNKYHGLNSFGKRKCVYHKCRPLIASLHILWLPVQLNDTLFKTLNSEIMYPV